MCLKSPGGGGEEVAQIAFYYYGLFKWGILPVYPAAEGNQHFVWGHSVNIPPTGGRSGSREGWWFRLYNSMVRSAGRREGHDLGRQRWKLHQRASEEEERNDGDGNYKVKNTFLSFYILTYLIEFWRRSETKFSCKMFMTVEGMSVNISVDSGTFLQCTWEKVLTSRQVYIIFPDVLKKCSGGDLKVANTIFSLTFEA